MYWWDRPENPGPSFSSWRTIRSCGCLPSTLRGVGSRLDQGYAAVSTIKSISYRTTAAPQTLDANAAWTDCSRPALAESFHSRRHPADLGLDRTLGVVDGVGCTSGDVKSARGSRGNLPPTATSAKAQQALMGAPQQ
jgi:hypothetical protein